MKDKIMMLIIGILSGAVLATGAFYIFNSTNSNNCNCENMQMNEPLERRGGENGGPPEMPNGERPEMPNGNNNMEPPEKSDSN